MKRAVFLPGWLLAAALLAGCGSSAYVRPGQPTGPPESFGGGEVVSRVMLVGDAGYLGGSAGVLPHVLARIDERTYTVFLGDNIYDWEDREAILESQLAAASRGRGALFLAGNHDWEEGFEGLVWEADAVRLAGGDWMPEPGCPGPEVRELPGLRIVALDSEWWLRAPADRPDLECGGGDPLDALAAELARPGDPVLLAVHHPLESFAKHGGHFPWYQHLLPPIFGSIYVGIRKSGRFSQDVSADAYAAWIEEMRGAMATHPPLLLAAGHEHSMQVLAGGRLGAEEEGAPVRPFATIVSGAGSKTSWVGAGDATLYSSGDRGFAVVTVLASGAIGAEAFHVAADGAECVRAWSGWLVPPAPGPDASP